MRCTSSSSSSLSPLASPLHTFIPSPPPYSSRYVLSTSIICRACGFRPLEATFIFYLLSSRCPARFRGSSANPLHGLRRHPESPSQWIRLSWLECSRACGLVCAFSGGDESCFWGGVVLGGAASAGVELVGSCEICSSRPYPGLLLTSDPAESCFLSVFV